MGQTQRAGLDDGCGLAGKEQPATEPPHQGGHPLGWIVVAQGAFAGVDPEQVMEAVADLANLVDPAGLQQLVVDQRVNQSLTSRRIEVENGRGHPGREVGRLQQAQPPERPLLAVGEGAVAEGDAGPDLQVAGGQLVQPPVFVGQPLGQPGQRPGRAGGQPGSGDPDGQRQPAAVADDGRRRIRFGGDPARSSHPAKQLHGRLGRQNVQVDQSCPSSPVRRPRLVTSTPQFGLPGSRGRTWASPAALSSTTSTRRSASSIR